MIALVVSLSLTCAGLLLLWLLARDTSMYYESQADRHWEKYMAEMDEHLVWRKRAFAAEAKLEEIRKALGDAKEEK